MLEKDSEMTTDNISVIGESRENLVEVYTKRRFFQKRTSVEKQLAIAAAILLILFLVFLVLYLVFQQYYYRLADEAICTTTQCIESAMMLLQTVNFSQNPCDDFYNFACGRFSQEHPIEDSYSHNSWFLEKEIRLNRLVRKVLEEPIGPEDLKCVRRTKLFYQSCTNATELNQLGLEPLFGLLELVQLPRTLPTAEEAESFNLGKTLALAQRHLSQDILITVSIARAGNRTETGGKNATVLKLSPGVSGLNIFRRWKQDKDVFDLRGALHTWSDEDDEDRSGEEPLKRLAPKKIILATISFITDILREIVKDLDQVDSYNTTELIATAYKIITFTTELDWSNNHNETEDGVEDQYTTFTALQGVLDEESKTSQLSNKIDWKEYITTLFKNVNTTYDVDNDLVIIENMDYFKFLSRVLGKSKPLSIQRHVWWKLVEEFGRYTTSNVRNAYAKYSQALYGENVVSTRSQSCTLVMRKFMNVALSHQMAKMDHFSGAVEKVRQMLKDIEQVFASLVDSVSWMDQATKFATMDKAKSIKDEIGYPPWLFEGAKVDQFYDGLDLRKSEFLKNIMRINEWEVEKVLVTIGPDKNTTSNDTVKWFGNPLQVNAYYSRIDNAITIPPGILQTPFYFRGLESLNYGAIGSILGHELTHGFDVDGKNYNKFGEKLENLWPESVTMEYESRAKCFVKQYEEYKIYKDKKLNGTMTLAENIADNGGMRESYKAYKLYSSRHGKEPKLPGFENFTHEQLLFLSFANIWCEDALPRYHLLGEDTHSPHRIRVLATLQNMKEFSEAYNCPPESFMNPRDKCIIW